MREPGEVIHLAFFLRGWGTQVQIGARRMWSGGPGLKAMKRPFEFTGRVRSFGYAGRGVWLTLKSQHNAWIHAAATLLVVIAGYEFTITRVEWCLVVLACAAVWTAEALNTAFEFLADATTKEFHPLIGNAKDVAAGAVLITAIAAFIVAGVIFGPYFRLYLSHVH